ncbi:MAG: hypothetical protein PHF63_00865 [Herbinix sp.]|nr:hypothetical protein [Herbinix sp.]
MQNTLNDLRHLLLKKMKTKMPHHDGSMTLGNAALFCGKSHNTVIDFLKNPIIQSNGYNHYFADFRYVFKIRSKVIRSIDKSNRKNIYKDISDQTRLKPVVAISSLNGRNFIFDLSQWNELFFTNSVQLPYLVKINQYFEVLNNMINDDRVSDYPNKFVLIDADDWFDDSKDLKINRKTVNNPIMILLYLVKNDMEKFKSLGNINFFIYNKFGVVRINPSECDDRSFALFFKAMKFFNRTLTTEEDLEDQIEKEDKNTKAISNAAQTVSNKIISKTQPNTVKEVKRIQKDAQDIAFSTIADKILDEEINSEVLTDDLAFEIKVANQINDKITKSKIGKTSQSIKRDTELKAKQRELKFNGKSIDRIVQTKNVKIEPRRIDIKKLNTVNTNILDVKYPAFEKEYNKELLEHDIISSFTNMNNKNIPVFVKSITTEDTSDELTLKKTLRVVLEDGNRVRHNVTVDIPEFVEDKFLYIGGNKKIINKQLFLKPISKTGEGVVQICTNYNKIFLRRYGSKLTSKTEKLNKFLTTKKPPSIKIKTANNINTNKKYKSTIEYDELSKYFSFIETNNYKLFFNLDELEEIKDKYKFASIEDAMIIGYYKEKGQPSTPIYVDYNSQNIVSLSTDNVALDIVDFVVANFDPKLLGEFNSTNVGKKYMYTRATIMKKNVPLVLLLSYCEGLSTVLRKAEIEYKFSDTRPRDLSLDYNIVKFSDGYLVYKQIPLDNALLMNAFVDIPTEDYSFSDFDNKDIYFDIFELLFGVRNIANAFDTFYEFMIDPISKEVLNDLDQPTEFVDVLLYGNKLMSDNSFIKENNMNIYRIRSNEVVAGLLYKAITKAYMKYRDTAGNNNPVKISIPRNQIIKDLLELQTVEDYPTLNPIVELSKTRTVSSKGLVGLNLDRSYTEEKRSYDKSMMGIIGMSTSPDANVGVNKELTLEPNIVSARGYVDIKDDKMDELKDTNLFSPAELLTPLGNTRDDTVRLSMSVKQSKHIIPVNKMSPVLVSNGAEQIVQYHLSKDFVNVADEDGEVVEIDNDTEIMVVKYKSGKVEAIDLYDNIVKNGGGGFFLVNKKDTKLKKGDKFKKDDIIAYNNKFFTDESTGVNRFNIGTLEKVAIIPSFATYEDSSYVTQKLADDMSSEIVSKKEVVLGPNSNVEFLVKKGDKVNVGDDLIIYDQSFDEGEMNKLLRDVSDDIKEEFKSIGKNKHSSKYSGVIEDVKIYCSVDLEDLSPSLRKVVSSYYSKVNKKKALLNKYDKTGKIVKAGLMITEPSSKIEETNGKIKGNEVNGGVLIEIYLKYNNTVGVGDKITFFSALKSVVGEVKAPGYEGYTDFRPDEEISSVIGPSAILQRMTTSILTTMFANKVIIELKRKVEDIYKG